MKRRYLIIFFLIFAAVGAAPRSQERIVGGITTTIDRYPFLAALLVTIDNIVYVQFCGGSIINRRSILSAAHCTLDITPLLRVRLGSTYASSGGVIHAAEEVFNHANFNTNLLLGDYNNDITVIRLTTSIVYDTLIQPVTFSTPNYVINDNDVVWSAGWGRTSFEGESSVILRHAQTWVINQEICASRYGSKLTSNMICTGWLDMGGRGQCGGDSGGPVVHNGIVIGITSWSTECVLGQFPTVNTRPSQYVEWIRERA